MAEYLISEETVLNYCAERGLRANTRRSYLNTFRTLGLLGSFTDTDVYLALERVTNSNTRRKHILVLHALGVKTPKCPPALSRQYHLPSQEEWEFYRALFPYPERINLMYYAGLRLSESVCDLNRVMGNVLTVSHQYPNVPAKTIGSVVIPRWLAASYPLTPWKGTANKLGKAIAHHSERTGIPLTAHGLRAAYATRLVEAGISLVGLQQQMRHSSVSTTLTHYVQVKQGELTNLVEGL